MAKVKAFAIVLVALLSVLAVGLTGVFAACPAGYYPDPADSNCISGVPYTVSIAHEYAGTGQMKFTITVTSVAKTATIGISSSSDYVVPKFTYGDGSNVQLGDYTRTGTTPSEAIGKCASYAIAPGQSVSFVTTVSFKQTQDGREITASADNLNWAVLPAYPGCSIAAQGRDAKIGADSFTYTYNPTPVQASCSGSGASCSDSSACCAGLECSGGYCAAPSAGQPTAPAYNNNGAGAPAASSSGSNMGMILGVVIGLVVLGGVAYFVFMRGGKAQSGQKRKK